MRSDIDITVFPSTDPRLDWVSMHDPASTNYPMRAVMGTSVPEKPRTWSTGPVLDQGAEGACVGFGWTAELIASPRPDTKATVEVAEAFAKSVYYEAQVIDEWPGEDYDGTSVLAGAKVLQSRGLIENYRWCFGIDDVRDAVISTGPVVIGIPWYDGMYGTRDSGLVEIDGEIVGGHCITITGYHPGMRIRGEDYHERFRVFRWRNSWGTVYGNGGDGLIRYEDLRDLLEYQSWGEACVPLGRKMVRL